MIINVMTIDFIFKDNDVSVVDILNAVDLLNDVVFNIVFVNTLVQLN